MSEQWNDDDRTIVFVGGGLVVGGSALDPDHPYLATVWGLLRSVDVNWRAWEAWWSEANAPRCEIFAWLGEPKSRVTVRRSTSRVLAQIDRSYPIPHVTSGLADSSAGVLARHDVIRLIQKLRDRFGLSEPPRLGTTC